MKTTKPISLAILLSLCALMIFSSCHKTPAAISLSDYPNKIGDQWVYFVYDSMAHTSDTLTVTIASAGSLNGAGTLLWQYSYSSGYIDTLQTLVSGDTVSYYTNTILPSVNFVILFPLMNGSNWAYPSGATYGSSYIGNYSVKGQNYSNVYDVTHIEQAPNYYLADNINISPKVGIVYRNINEAYYVNQTWLLMSYRVN